MALRGAENRNGRKWPGEWPEWPAIEKSYMVTAYCRMRLVRISHAYLCAADPKCLP